MAAGAACFAAALDGIEEEEKKLEKVAESHEFSPSSKIALNFASPLDVFDFLVLSLLHKCVHLVYQ